MMKQKQSTISTGKIYFEQVTSKYKNVIFHWLAEPHVQEFWDNSQEHKDDIVKFINGRKEPSNYANGNYVYWIALIDNHPYSLIMTIKENKDEERPQIKNDHLSTTGSTYSIDFMIGDKDYFGKGLGARTLEEFTLFIREKYDKRADTLFIDPDELNPRAKHIYEKAGFKYIGDFIMAGHGVFAGRKTHFMVKKLLRN